MKRFITLILIGMLMLTGCSSEGLATVSNGSPAADENMAAEAAGPDEGSRVESASSAETGPDDTQAESAQTGPADTQAETAQTGSDDTQAESAPTEHAGTVLPGEDIIDTEPVGKVIFTRLSREDVLNFTGRELKTEPTLSGQVDSYDVFRCGQPLNRVEVRPIQQWAADYTSYTVSDEVLGSIKSLGAEEAFRIYDLFPEGLPANCAVFYLEDGSCGTFSLGFNGSGEEHSVEYGIYKNFPSMNAALSRKAEEGAVKAILDEYRDISEKYRSEGLSDLDEIIRNGVIPPFGHESTNYDGTPYFYASECHFGEICGGTWENTGIARKDLNGDGTDELLVGFFREEEQKDDGPTTLYAAYSVKRGEIQTLFHGWSRSVYYLAQDGSIIHTGSSGAANYMIVNYELVENEKGVLALKEKETLVSDGFENPEKPFTWYPDGRELVGYDENDVPEYSAEKEVQMDEETGREYYQKIFDRAGKVDLQAISR